MSERDAADETFETIGRMAVTSAARVGQALARMRQEQQQRAAHQSEQRAGQLAARLEAEATAARTLYQGVESGEWWTATAPAEVARTYQTAAAWRDTDPRAAEVAQLMEREIPERYDVDVRTAGAELGPRLEAASHELAHQETVQTAEAATLLQAADQADQAATAAESEVEAGWDTPQRRATTRQEVDATVNDPEAVDARMRADVAQARPAREATAPARPPRARKSPSRVGTGRGRQRDLSR